MTTAHALPDVMRALIDEVGQRLHHRPKIARMFARCFPNTYQTTLRSQTDGTTFVLTGDIPAMWLRDSAAQVRPYIGLARHDADLRKLLEGVVRRQVMYIRHDPYANAFNEMPNGKRHSNDRTAMSDLVWERKYEIDSLCYPLQLAYQLWKVTGTTAHLDAPFVQACTSILELWRREQKHEQLSPYRFQRDNCPPSDTLPYEGLGNPVAWTGMTWSGFRPSDDACQYGYLVPSNMFAIVVLAYMAEITTEVLLQPKIAHDAQLLRQELKEGLERHAVINHPTYGRMYAYEVDGLGNHNLMDDANIPSLLSLPYLRYCPVDDATYLNTRRFVLSTGNPYFFEGCVAKGVGSPHTPHRYAWHLALAMQGLTSSDESEWEGLLDIFEGTDAGTELMHESFCVDDPSQYTRPWFGWANSLFSEFILQYCGLSMDEVAS